MVGERGIITDSFHTDIKVPLVYAFIILITLGGHIQGGIKPQSDMRGLSRRNRPFWSTCSSSSARDTRKSDSEQNFNNLVGKTFQSILLKANRALYIIIEPTIGLKETSVGQIKYRPTGHNPRKGRKRFTMHNMSRLFAIKDSGNYSGWTTVDRTSFVISVKGDMMTVTKKSGRDMYPEEINTAFGRFLQEYEQEFGEKVALYERSNPYRFCFRTGVSGCQDTYIEIDTGDGFPQRKFIMHESCFGKCEGFSSFVYDFLDLCVAGGFLGVTKDGFYVYREEEDSNSDCEMQTIKPRLLAYEEGWNSPWQKPDKVVPLQVCREVPDSE